MQPNTFRSSRAWIGCIALFILIAFFCVPHFQDFTLDNRSGDSDNGDDYDFVDDVLDTKSEGGPLVRQATVTLHDEYDPAFERAIKTHVEHGRAWGYPTHVLRHSMLDGRSQFNKISYLQLLLLGEMAKPYGQRAGWIVWFDTDTIILNPKVPWTLFLPPTEFSDIHLVAAKNWDGFNSGVFFLRVHEWSVKMLTDAQALPSLKPEIPLPWPDQSAMFESFSRPQFRDGFVYQPLHWYNEFQLQASMVKDDPNVHPGDMLIHFAGLAGDKRELMGPWLDRVESTPDDWALPLENTTYPDNVREFWHTYGQAKDQLHQASQTLAANKDTDDQESLQPVRRVAERLQSLVWEAADDMEALREHTQILAEALSQVPSQDPAANSHRRRRRHHRHLAEEALQPLESESDGELVSLESSVTAPG